MRKKFLRLSKTEADMSDLTADYLVEEARQGFKAKAEQLLSWRGKGDAIRRTSAYFGMSESQGQRLHYGNLKNISALPYLKITNWYAEFCAREERLAKQTVARIEAVKRGTQDARRLKAMADAAPDAVSGMAESRHSDFEPD